MSGQTERAHTTRGFEGRLHRRATQQRTRPTSADGITTLQQKDTIIHRQRTKLAQYVDVSKKIIEEFLDAEEDTVEDVSPSELLKVIDYVKLMKSSVEIFQTINAALKDRIDELLFVSERDAQILQYVLSYVQSLPVLHAARDAHTNQVNFLVDFHSDRSIQAIPASNTACSSSREASSSPERRLGGQRKVNWLRNVLSAAVCVVIGTSVARSGFGKPKSNP